MLSLTTFASLGKLVSAFISCGLITGVCLPTPVPQEQAVSTPAFYHQNISMETLSTSSPDVTIETNFNGKKDKRVVAAPYGVKSSFVSITNGSSTRTEATTTPLTKDDALTMERNEEEQVRQMQQEMDRMFAQQQQLFAHAFSDF
jgi:hypothetical protein